MRVSAWQVAAVFLLSIAPAAAATMEDVVAATYDGFSVTPPTPAAVYICHGFGCKYRSEVAFGPKDRATLTQLMAAGKASSAAERAAIAKAGAWFDKRVGPEAGTQHHVARAGAKYMYDTRQLDCIDASRNTTTLLLVLEQLKLLRHHEVDVPVARGYLIDGRPPHVTAVLVDQSGGTKWAVDSW